MAKKLARIKGEVKINRRLWLTGEAVDKGAVQDSLLLDETTGLMCCLGQFCRQLGAKKKDILERGTPDELFDTIENPVSKVVGDKIKASGLVRKTGLTTNTATTSKLMEANDASFGDAPEDRVVRETKIAQLFRRLGYKTKFIGRYPDYRAIGRSR